MAARAAALGAHAIASSAAERAAIPPALSAIMTRRGADTLPGRLVSRLTAAGEAAWSAGTGARARTLLDRALRADPSPIVRAHACEVLGAVDTRSGNLANALGTLLGAARGVLAVDAAVAVRLLAVAVHVSFYLGAGRAAGQRRHRQAPRPRGRSHFARGPVPRPRPQGTPLMSTLLASEYLKFRMLRLPAVLLALGTVFSDALGGVLLRRRPVTRWTSRRRPGG